MMLAWAGAGCASQDPFSGEITGDQTVAQTCWPDSTPSDTGTVDIGTSAPFAVLDDDAPVTLVVGNQGEVHLDVQARIGQLSAGEPGNARSPLNPYTRFFATAEEGTELGNFPCGLRFPYVTAAEDDQQLLDRDVVLPLYNHLIPPDTASDHIGERIRIGVEVMDANMRYAFDEHWVTIAEVRQPSSGP